MSSAPDHSNNEYAAKLAQQSRTPKQHQVPAKVYFHRHNYAKFHFDMGTPGNTKSAAFANYRYITDDKREQDQLDLVADAPGTMIYTMADSDVNAALEIELQQEMAKSVKTAAQAHAAVHGQQFDPNAPIVPMRSEPIQPTAVRVTPVAPQGHAVKGMQNSLSGTQATEGIAHLDIVQTKSPDPQQEALARIAALTPQK